MEKFYEIPATKEYLGLNVSLSSFIVRKYLYVSDWDVIFSLTKSSSYKTKIWDNSEVVTKTHAYILIYNFELWLFILWDTT